MRSAINHFATTPEGKYTVLRAKLFWHRLPPEARIAPDFETPPTKIVAKLVSFHVNRKRLSLSSSSLIQQQLKRYAKNSDLLLGSFPRQVSSARNIFFAPTVFGCLKKPP